jgi:hypothetical protein
MTGFSQGNSYVIAAVMEVVFLWCFWRVGDPFPIIKEQSGSLVLFFLFALATVYKRRRQTKVNVCLARNFEY